MLVIHIGPRKTATTYLQSNFYRNRKELLRRGWLYPALSLAVQNVHHVLVQSRAEIASGKGSLVRSMGKAGKVAAARNANILVSSENFRKWKAGDFKLIGERFGQKDIVIAYTLRDPLDLLMSGWSESVKTGKTASLADYARKHLSDPMQSPVLNCLNQLEPILERPELRLVVLNFEAVKRAREDIYVAFGREILGLEGLRPARQKPRNQSFSVEINDFLRLLSRTMNFDHKKSDLLFSRQFSRTHSPAEIEAIAETIRRVGADVAEKLSFSRDEPWYDALQDKIRERLGSRIVPPSPDGRLFPRGVVEAVSYDIDKLGSHPEIRAQIETSIARMRTARQKWGRSPVVAAWRYVRRLFSV